MLWELIGCCGPCGQHQEPLKCSGLTSAAAADHGDWCTEFQAPADRAAEGCLSDLAWYAHQAAGLKLSITLNDTPQGQPPFKILQVH